MFKPDFSELPVNPIRIARDKKSMTVAQLSRAGSVSPQVIRDLEAGILRTIPTQLISFLDNDSSGNILDRQYNEWRNFKRSLVFLPPVGLLSISSDVHPFAQYRNKINIVVTTLCDYLCIPRFVIMHYEKEQRRMPALLRQVLPQAHLKQRDVDKLSNLGEVFYSAREQRKINEQHKAHGQNN